MTWDGGAHRNSSAKPLSWRKEPVSLPLALCCSRGLAWRFVIAPAGTLWVDSLGWLPRSCATFGGEHQHVIDDRIGTARKPGVSAVGGVCPPGQRSRHGGLPRDVRGGRARLRRILGEACACRSPVEKAVHQDARRIARAVLQVVLR